nr:unnamed protein product [Spodoptera littoralis]
MPPKRLVRRDDGSESDTSNDFNRTVVTSPNITMSEEMLQALISKITQSQMEASRLLIETMLANKDAPSPSSPPRPPETRDVYTARRAGNFAKCTARFDGSTKNAEALEAFIDAIEIYRDCTNISDEHALRGLPMLLVGEAAVWWQGVKSSVTSWTDALQRLRGMYGVPRPGYKIFRDIFRAEQNSERADVYINKVRALTSKLPYVIPEEMLLDIVYGLLDRRIRKRVPRDAVSELEQLVAKARLVEESLAEVNNPSFTVDSNQNNINNVNPSVVTRERSSTDSNPTITVGDSSRSNKLDDRSADELLSDSLRKPVAHEHDANGKTKRNRPKCTNCKLFGHTADSCRNKDRRNISLDNSGRVPRVSCYGCGQEGVVRSKCSNCNKLDFHSVHVQDSEGSRPFVEIQVANRNGVAILDTGATHSIAGSMLYELLIKAGTRFKKTSRIVGLADGTQQLRTALECDTEVSLQGRIIPITFIVLPDAQTRTLLGGDFIRKAGILLDLPQCNWRFNNEPRVWYSFHTNFELPTGGQRVLKKVDVRSDRNRKSTNSTINQRVQLGTLSMNRTRSPNKKPRRAKVEKLNVAGVPSRGRGWFERSFITHALPGGLGIEKNVS